MNLLVTLFGECVWAMWSYRLIKCDIIPNNSYYLYNAWGVAHVTFTIFPAPKPFRKKNKIIIN